MPAEERDHQEAAPRVNHVNPVGDDWPEPGLPGQDQPGHGGDNEDPEAESPQQLA